jgi:hypothetical protein
MWLLSARCVVLVALVLGTAAVPLTEAAESQSVPGRSFQDDACGIAFTVPSAWTLTVSYPQQCCCTINFAPPPERDIVRASPGSEDEPCHFGKFSISVARRSVEDAALGSGFFIVEGKWHYDFDGSVFDNVQVLTGKKGWHGVHAQTSGHLCGSAQTWHDFEVGHDSRAVSIRVHDGSLDVVETLLGTLTIAP